MKYFKILGKTTLMPFVFLLIISSCGKDKAQQQPQPVPNPPPVSDADLIALPKDLGGVQTPVFLTKNIKYGYYVYTPSGYTGNQANYPLLVYLHGSGDVGNSLTNPTDLKRILNYGPPQLIYNKKWSPKYPMIVVSPQSSVGFIPDSLNEFIKYVIKTYRINTHRIYLTGLSLGGGGTFSYITNYPNNGSYVAAAIPMSAPYEKHTNISNLVKIPIWTFIGGDDVNVLKLVTTIDLINQLSPTYKAKITVFPGVGHNCWDLAYSGSGMGRESKSYDAFNMSIYDWMFQYSK